MKDLTILMDLEIGRPAAMLGDLAAQGHTVTGGCFFPRLGGRVAHLAVDDDAVDAVSAIIEQHGGVVADSRDCVVVPADHEGGAVAAARAVADAGIVVQISYFGAEGEIIIGAGDAAGVLDALGLG